MFGGFPRVILQSEDSLVKLQASHERIDFFRAVDDDSSVDVTTHFSLAVDLFTDYMETMQARSGRVAGLVSRAAFDEDPARTISRHFCRDEWLEGSINRPEAFEVHALKTYKMAGSVAVNSWVRCKSGELVRGEAENKIERRIVLVEQDLNTPAGEATRRPFSPSDVREFFELAPNELDVIFGLYFPNRQEPER